jgi:hypothetical protein
MPKLHWKKQLNSNSQAIKPNQQQKPPKTLSKTFFNQEEKKETTRREETNVSQAFSWTVENLCVWRPFGWFLNCMKSDNVKLLEILEFVKHVCFKPESRMDFLWNFVRFYEVFGVCGYMIRGRLVILTEFCLHIVEFDRYLLVGRWIWTESNWECLILVDIYLKTVEFGRHLLENR